MKDINMIKDERYELSQELKLLVIAIKSNKSLLKYTEQIKRLFTIVGLIRALDWTLDSSELTFNEFCLKTDDAICNEFDIDFQINNKKEI